MISRRDFLQVGMAASAIVGAGGDRDATKRPLMGRAAAENADIVFVTDDNPRSEDPALVRAALVAGARDVDPHRVHEVPDRREAIRRTASFRGRPRTAPMSGTIGAGRSGERRSGSGRGSPCCGSYWTGKITLVWPVPDEGKYSVTTSHSAS